MTKVGSVQSTGSSTLSPMSSYDRFRSCFETSSEKRTKKKKKGSQDPHQPVLVEANTPKLKVAPSAHQVSSVYLQTEQAAGMEDGSRVIDRKV